MPSGDSEENTDNADILSVSEFLSENYNLFAVAGVLAALAVYLRDFRPASPNGSVEFGVVSALLMFSLVSGVLLLKSFDQAITAQEVELSRVAGYSVLIMGIIGLLYSILSITAIFQTQLVRVIDIGFVVGILSGYLIWFPTKRFNEPTENISEKTRNAIGKIPEVAVITTFLTYIFVNNNYSEIIQSYMFIEYLDQVISAWPFLIGVSAHYMWCLVIRRYYIFRDNS